jgi:hypothetical protein
MPKKKGKIKKGQNRWRVIDIFEYRIVRFPHPFIQESPSPTQPTDKRAAKAIRCPSPLCLLIFSNPMKALIFHRRSCSNFLPAPFPVWISPVATAGISIDVEKNSFICLFHLFSVLKFSASRSVARAEPVPRLNTLVVAYVAMPSSRSRRVSRARRYL